MHICAGIQAPNPNPGSSVYPRAHPVRGISLATLGKLLLVECGDADANGVDRGGSNGSRGATSHGVTSILPNPPNLPPQGSPLRLQFAKQVLTQAYEELRDGFGRDARGGGVGAGGADGMGSAKGTATGGEVGASVATALAELEREQVVRARALAMGWEGEGGGGGGGGGGKCVRVGSRASKASI